MNKYILDTGFFIVIRHYYPETFPSFWNKLNETIKSQTILSVEQVRAELEGYRGEETHLDKWIKEHKDIFTNPSKEEQDIVQEIFSHQKFRTLITVKQRLSDKPVADPFIIAKAIHVQSNSDIATVVTSEQAAKKDNDGNIQGSYHIPDVCEHYHIKCISPLGFMKEQGWNF